MTDISIGPNPDISNPTVVPWVSISATGDWTYNNYSFTVPPQGVVQFDIDYGYVGGVGNDEFNTYIQVWDAILPL